MKTVKQPFALSLSFSLAFSVGSHKPRPKPRHSNRRTLATSFRPGAGKAAEFEVRVGGQFLDGVAQARISGPGMQVKVVELVKPMSQQQVNQLREQLKALTDRLPAGQRQVPSAFPATR